MAVLNSSHCRIFWRLVLSVLVIFSGDVQVLTPSRKDLHQHSVYFTGVSTDTIGNKVQGSKRGINTDTPRYGGINTDTPRYEASDRHHKVWRHQYRHPKVWRHQYRHPKVWRHQYRHLKVWRHQGMEASRDGGINTDTTRYGGIIQTPQGVEA